MGFRFYRRANLGGGLGLNLSKSGVSSSLRTKYGSFGSRGFSIPTGIKGLYYRGGSGSKNAGLAVLIMLMIAGAAILAYFLVELIIRMILFLWFWIVKEDHLDYTHLIIFLSTVLIIFMAVYFYLPLKS
jgi:hypothetical protein